MPSMQSTLRTRERRRLDAEQFDGAERDRIGPHRRAQREGAARMAQMRRHLLDQIAPRLVHPVEQDDVAVELQVLEARARSADRARPGRWRPIAAVFFGHSARDLNGVRMRPMK